MKTEAETGGRRPQAQGRPEPPEAGRGGKDPPLEPLEGVRPWDTLTSDVWSPGWGRVDARGFHPPGLQSFAAATPGHCPCLPPTPALLPVHPDSDSLPKVPISPPPSHHSPCSLVPGRVWRPLALPVHVKIPGIPSPASTSSSTCSALVFPGRTLSPQRG